MEEKNNLKKYKLIYSGELIIIALVAIVLSVLFYTNTIKVADWKKWVFTIITLVGGIWTIVDYIWTMKSERRRKKSSIVDKILLLPNGAALIVFDIYGLIRLANDPTWVGDGGNKNYFSFIIGSALLYVAIAYIVEGIYHYFVTHPMVYEMIEDDEKEAKAKENNEDKNKV